MSSRDLNLLHPSTRAKALKLMAACGEKGLNVLLYDTRRTRAEQNRLFAQGRTAPGRIVTNASGDSMLSMHMWSIAVDFCKNVRGQEFSDAGFFTQVGELAESFGLEWGGRWRSFPDRPHLQDSAFISGSQSPRPLINQFGTPERFFASWPIGAGAANPIVPKPPATLIPSPPKPPANTSLPVLRRGSRGAAVRDLQSRLGGLAADGVFGPATEARVREYQRANRLIVDGIVGPQTWNALRGADSFAPAIPATVRRGSKGETVRQLQQRLNAQGANPRLAEDGVFGPLTDAAVRAFQRHGGLTADGVAGPLTWGKLLS